MLATRTRVGVLIVALAANLVLASTLQVREARACSCAGSFSAEEELRNSDAVFWGEALSVEEQASTSRSFPPLMGPVTFDVKKSWKGVSREQVIVHGQGNEASCGLDFDEGETYLVFAYRVGKGESGPLETGLCTPTVALSDVGAAPAALGPPTDQLPDTGGPDAWSFGDDLTAAAVVVLVSLVLTGVIVARQQRREEQP